MRRLSVTKSFIVVFAFAVFAVSLPANPLQSSNHRFNPALLGVRERGIFELGMTAESGLANSYFSIGDIFQTELLLDFNDMASRLSGGDLNLGTTAAAETHLAFSLFGVSLGYYLNVEGISSVAVPGDLIRLLGSGNTLGVANVGSGDIFARLFMETGLFAGYRWKNFQFGAKLGAFAPLIYSDSSSRFDYTVTTNEAPVGTQGIIEASASITMPFYSVVDFNAEEQSAEDLLAALNGLNLGIGFVKVEKKKAMYGVSVTGITIKPAVAGYEMLLSGYVNYSIDSLMDEESEVTEDSRDVDVVTVGSANKTISTPVQIGGFYRLAGYPGFIDWIGHGSFTFDDELLVTLGVTAEGSYFPWSIFSIGLEYDRIVWRTTLGLRANLKFVEIGADVGLCSPEIFSMLSSNGVYGKVYFALGL